MVTSSLDICPSEFKVSKLTGPYVTFLEMSLYSVSALSQVAFARARATSCLLVAVIRFLASAPVRMGIINSSRLLGQVGSAQLQYRVTNLFSASKFTAE